MTLNDPILDKLVTAEKEIAAARGPFILFALILREEFVNVASTSSTGFATMRWDLVMAANWLSRTKADYEYLVAAIQKRLSKDEVLNISRLVVLEPESPIVGVFNKSVQVEHGRLEVRDSNFQGVDIQAAYVITSKRRSNARKPTTESSASSKR